MQRKAYIQPIIKTRKIHAVNLLAGSERTIPYDPEDGTDDALIGEKEERWGNLWDDNCHPQKQDD